MIAVKRKLGLLVLDIVSINIALILAALVFYEGAVPAIYRDALMHISLGFTIITISVLYLFRLYKSLWQYASIDELIMIVTACIIATFGCYIYFTIKGFHIHTSIYVIYCFLIMAFTGSSRISYRIFRRFRLNFFNNGLKEYKRVMVIGAGEAGLMVIKELRRHPEMGLKPVAIIDDDKTKHNSKLMGVYIYGGRDYIQKVAEEKSIDEIIVAIPSAPKVELKAVLNECKKTRCKLKTLPGVYELIEGVVSIQQIRAGQIEDLLGREPVKMDLDEVSQYIQDEVILVTGGGGSIGSELCRQIAQFHPKELIILDAYENNAYNLQQELKRNYPELNQTVIIASVRDKSRMDVIFEQYRPKVVFHAAAYKHVPLMELNPTEAIKNNIFGTQNVAECADKYGTKKFVLISTDKAVNPTNIMGATKRVAEMIIQAMARGSKTEFVAVRFGNVLGSNGSVIPLFKDQIASGGPVTVTHPKVNRFFMTIPEAVQLVIQAGALASGGEIFVLDMGEPVKIVDLAEDLIRLSGLEPNIDIDIQFTGLRPGEKLYEELLMDEEGLTATKYEKIFIAKPTFLDLNELKDELMRLKFVLAGSDENLIKLMEDLVPTYKRLYNVN